MSEGSDAVDRLSWRYRTFTLAEVAEVMEVTPNYLWRCVRAAEDKSRIEKYRLTPTSLKDMPVKGWFKRAKLWRIREVDLTRQLNERYGVGAYEI